MGLPSTPYFLYFGSVVAHSHFFTPYTAHGLLIFLFPGSFKPIYPLKAHLLSHGPVIHYSYCLGLMGFLFIYQFFSVNVAGLFLSTWTFQMAINTQKFDGLMTYMIRLVEFYFKDNNFCRFLYLNIDLGREFYPPLFELYDEDVNEITPPSFLAYALGSHEFQWQAAPGTVYHSKILQRYLGRTSHRWCQM